MSKIDWTDPKSQVSTNFNVKDCLYLPTWGRLANESDGLTDEIKENLVNTCAKMEVIRIVGGNKPIKVHCMFRPPMYNKIIGGATRSAHLTGEACDFSWLNESTNKGCDDFRSLLIPKLEDLDIRMEDLSAKTSRAWVHIDTKKPSPNRYFKP
jgi:hypothetical protein